MNFDCLEPTVEQIDIFFSLFKLLAIPYELAGEKPTVSED